MLKSANLRKRAFVPTRLLSPKMKGKAQNSLLFVETPKPGIHDDAEGVESVEEETICDEFWRVTGGYSLPRAWAVKNLPEVEWTDNTEFPRLRVKFPKQIEPWTDQQTKFFTDLLAAAKQSDGPENILANATTGSGKTVAGLYLGQQLKTPTIIIVDRTKIGNGWVKQATQFFGKAWVKKHVGWVQQDRCEWEGKAYVIALGQSLYRRKYADDFYNNFGLAIIDEIQIFGGPAMSPNLHMFPARVRIGLTAENRGGDFGKLIKAHVGDTRVVSKQEVMLPHAYVLRNEIPHTFYCQSEGALLTNLSRLNARNGRIAQLIKNRAYDRGRQTLVMSNRTAQLVTLKRLCVRLGIPDEAIGLHMGSYISDRMTLSYRLQDGGPKRKVGVYATRARAQTAQIHIDALSGAYYAEAQAAGNIPKALYIRLQAGQSVMWVIDREEYKPTENELDDITNSCQIIFATYEIFAKGVNVPRLDLGIEALPSGNVKQPLGRILRIKEGKATPEWYAVHDVIKPKNIMDVDTATMTYLNNYFTAKTKARYAALRKAKAKVSTQ